MSSRKCSKCGLVSFATADNCKRCSTSLKDAQAKAVSNIPSKEIVFDDDEPRRGISPLKILLLILLIALPCWYYFSSSQKAVDAGEQADREKLHQNLQKLSDIDSAHNGYKIRN